jgi:excisionase family DNA binding protein
MTELRTVAETAEALRVSRATVYRLVKDRKLRVTKVRGSTFVAQAEIDRYLKNAERGRVA